MQIETKEKSTYNREEGVMVLCEGQAHLVVVVVVWLSVDPVEPLDGLVHVVPGPCAGLVLAVPPLAPAPQPEGFPPPRLRDLQQVGLQPVVDPWPWSHHGTARLTWVVQLRDDGVVAVADELGRGPGHSLLRTKQEAPATRPVLLAREGKVGRRIKPP